MLIPSIILVDFTWLSKTKYMDCSTQLLLKMSRLSKQFWRGFASFKHANWKEQKTFHINVSEHSELRTNFKVWVKWISQDFWKFSEQCKTNLKWIYLSWTVSTLLKLLTLLHVEIDLYKNTKTFSLANLQTLLFSFAPSFNCEFCKISVTYTCKRKLVRG